MPDNTSLKTPTQITDADAVTLSAWIKQGDVSCREVMEAYLQRIDQFNPSLNAIVSRVDGDKLLATAVQRDAQLAAGEYLGPLHGFPQAPKDLASVKDMPTSMGSPLFAGNIPGTDSVSVARIRESGAIFVGRTNTPEFGLGGQTYNQVFGATLNPWDTSKTPAGSSGGAAVALAAHMLPVADGSDMMGSLRTPAAYNNVFGFRNTRGLIPSGPGPELFLNQFSVDGAMARNVPDLALLLGVMAGRDTRVPLSNNSDPSIFGGSLERNFKGKRIGWLADFGAQLPVEAEVLSICEKALKTFETIGCKVERIDAEGFGFRLESLFESWTTLRSFIMAGSMGAWYAEPAKRAQMKAELVWEIERGLAYAATDVYAASVTRSAWYQRLRILFSDYDFLVLPGAQLLPFPVETHWPTEVAGRKMDSYHRWMEVVIPASLAGVPAISAPAGFSATGLPMGIQILGPAQADFEVLQLAYAYDMARGRADSVRPPLKS